MVSCIDLCALAIYDVNVTPDKRSLYLHDERRIIDELTVKYSLGYAKREGILNSGYRKGSHKS